MRCDARREKAIEGGAQVRHWTPKDDANLIFAMEKGASFESLAKGAVRFSQRYTLTELQDRWRILLYNTNAFDEASIQMVAREELFPPGGSQSTKRGKRKRKESKGLSWRRKSESVYRHYMRAWIFEAPWELRNLLIVNANQSNSSENNR